MPNPTRRQPLLMIDPAFCRREVQVVLRKHLRAGGTHGRKATAERCIHVFDAVMQIHRKDFDPGSVKNEERNKGIAFIVAATIKQDPVLYAELHLALVKSEIRMGKLKFYNADRLIEKHFTALRDVKKNKKLAEAISSDYAIQGGIRDRLSRANRIIRFWSKAADFPLNTWPLVFDMNGNVLIFDRELN